MHVQIIHVSLLYTINYEPNDEEITGVWNCTQLGTFCWLTNLRDLVCFPTICLNTELIYTFFINKGGLMYLRTG